jgi:putative transposase
MTATAADFAEPLGHYLPDLRKRYWGRHFWAPGYFSTTSGNITDDVILQYLQEHEPTGVSR